MCQITVFTERRPIAWLGDVTEREKSEVQIVAECYTNTTVNIRTALGFFSRMCILQSLEMLESEHHLLTALSVESCMGPCKQPRSPSEGGRFVLRRKWDFP